MPDQPDQTSAPAQDDPRDIRIQELEAQLQEHRDETTRLNQEADATFRSYEAKVRKLQDQLKRAAVPATPSGDFVSLGGSQYPVITTVRANTTFDEVKKGVIEEGLTLVVIQRVH